MKTKTTDPPKLPKNLLQSFKEEYSKRIRSGLAWSREETSPGKYIHETFKPEKFLSRFSEEDAAAIAAGQEGRVYKQDRRFARLRRLLEQLSPEQRERLLEEFPEEIE